MATEPATAQSRSLKTTGCLVHTPMGWVGAIARANRLLHATLPRPTQEAALATCLLEVRFDRPTPLLLRLAEDLRRYFSGEVVDFTDYPVDIAHQSPFSRRVLLAARRIPYGEVRSYAWLARMARSPRAFRAAGQAMSRNPLPLVIPCHRVVRADGSLGGFGGGQRMKRALLLLEGVRVGRS